jgi:hypothetical protein
VSSTSAERPDLLPPGRKLEVEEQLARNTRSAASSASPRCQQLLTYQVVQSIAGSYDLLPERVMGAEVFGRNASYDTEGDSIVRVRANDLRKRLAQYYDGAPGAIARSASNCLRALTFRSSHSCGSTNRGSWRRSRFPERSQPAKASACDCETLGHCPRRCRTGNLCSLGQLVPQ